MGSHSDRVTGVNLGASLSGEVDESGKLVEHACDFL